MEAPPLFLSPKPPIYSAEHPAPPTLPPRAASASWFFSIAASLSTKQPSRPRIHLLEQLHHFESAVSTSDPTPHHLLAKPPQALTPPIRASGPISRRLALLQLPRQHPSAPWPPPLRLPLSSSPQLFSQPDSTPLKQTRPELLFLSSGSDPTRLQQTKPVSLPLSHTSSSPHLTSGPYDPLMADPTSLLLTATINPSQTRSNNLNPTQTEKQKKNA